MSHPPTVEFSAFPGFYPGMDMLYLAELVGSWDGGPFKPLAYGIYRSSPQDEPSWRIPVPVSRLFDEITPNPHTLDLRTIFHVFRPGQIPFEGSSLGAPGQPDLTIDRGRAMRKISRSIGSFTINLFEEYPEDFPRKVPLAQLGTPLESWFRVRRVRIVRVRIPDGTGYGIEHSHGPMGGLIPKEEASSSGQVACVELIGMLNPELPIPFAAEATLRIPGQQDPLLVFPFQFGRGFKSFGFAHWEDLDDGTFKELGLWEQLVSPAVLPQANKDGITAGQLDLKPSRSLAIDTGRFDRFIGDEIHLPIEVEIITVDGRWVEEEDVKSRR